MRKMTVIFILCAVPALAGICQMQPVGVKGDDPLFGTWVNEQYDKDSSGRSGSGKSINLPDGHTFDYPHIADNVPSFEGWIVVEKSWVDDQGRRWYKLKTVGWLYPSKAGKVEGFGLNRISADGSTVEWVWAQYGYPEDISPLGSFYGSQHRQK